MSALHEPLVNVNVESQEGLKLVFHRSPPGLYTPPLVESQEGLKHDYYANMDYYNALAL